MTESRPLNFSALQPRYESVASFENENKQQFVVKVSGLNKVDVERYISNLRGHLQVLQNESISQLSEAISVPIIETAQPLLEDETEFLNETLEELKNTLEVAIGFAKPEDFPLSGILNFSLINTIQRPIEGGETVVETRILPRASNVEAKIKVTIGSVFAELWKQLPSGRWQSVDRATINAINTVTLSDRVTSRTRFKVKVTGLGNQDSEYDISGNWDDFL